MWNGVEYQNISTPKFNTIKQAEILIRNAGKILAYDTCAKSRGSKENKMCSISTMKDMYDIVGENDKVLTF